MRTALESRVADDVLNKLRMEYKIRAEKLCASLSTERRIEIVNRPLGGYFVWIKFPESVNSEKFLEFCSGRVNFMLGVRCDIASGDGMGTDSKTDKRLFTSHARLCFADVNVDVLDTGICELIACFGEYMLTALECS